MAEKSQIFDVFKKSPDKERVLILGGGFAGIETALRLDTRRFEVLLLDRHNYFTFQPLLYQVATGGLEPDSIAYPLRQIVRRNRGVLFRVAEIESLDPIARQVVTSIGTLPYDHAVIATGSMTNFFGDQQLQQHALSLKQVRDALANIGLQAGRQVSGVADRRHPGSARLAHDNADAAVQQVHGRPLRSVDAERSQ